MPFDPVCVHLRRSANKSGSLSAIYARMIYNWITKLGLSQATSILRTTTLNEVPATNGSQNNGYLAQGKTGQSYLSKKVLLDAHAANEHNLQEGMNGDVAPSYRQEPNSTALDT